jgi:hypothetical protein
MNMRATDEILTSCLVSTKNTNDMNAVNTAEKNRLALNKGVKLVILDIL